MTTDRQGTEPNIAQLKAKGDVEALVQALTRQKDPSAHQQAEDALLEIGAPAVVSLARALRDADMHLRPVIRATLDKMGQEVLRPLLFYFDQQGVVLHDFDAPGYILDIGAGGEGVIGRWKGAQVIAIDPCKKELEEAPSGPLKVLMDARDLQFLDGSFWVATSFFSLMYMSAADHTKVFAEVFRVLVSGGRFLIWDAILPQCLDEDKGLVVVPLVVGLPGEEITAAYGTLWPEHDQDLAYYLGLARHTGFQVIVQAQHEQTFFLELQRP